eukprot:914219_1
MAILDHFSLLPPPFYYLLTHSPQLKPVILSLRHFLHPFLLVLMHQIRHPFLLVLMHLNVSICVLILIHFAHKIRVFEAPGTAINPIRRTSRTDNTQHPTHPLRHRDPCY